MITRILTFLREALTERTFPLRWPSTNDFEAGEYPYTLSQKVEFFLVHPICKMMGHKTNLYGEFCVRCGRDMKVYSYDPPRYIYGVSTNHKDLTEGMWSEGLLRPEVYDDGMFKE